MAAALPPSGALVVATALALVLAAVAALLVRPAVRSLEPAKQRVLITWVIAWAALFAVYPMFFFATYFYPRYAAPLAAIGLPLLAAGISGRVGRRTARAAVAGIVIVFVTTAFLTLHNRAVGNVNVLTAGYVAERLPPNESVGAFRAASSAYFNGERREPRRSKSTRTRSPRCVRGDLADFIDARNIRYLADWPGIVGTLPAAYLARAWVACPERTPDVQILVWRGSDRCPHRAI